MSVKSRSSKKAPNSKPDTKSVPMGEYPDPRHHEVHSDREWPEGDYLPPQPEPVRVERLWNKYGWLISYEAIGAGAVLVSRSYYGQALDSREMSVMDARSHYAAQMKARMEPVPAL